MKNGKIWKGIATIMCAGCLVLTACTGSEIKARFTLNEQGELICTYPDGSEENLGRVTGENGADGRDGTDGKDGADGRDGLDGENGSDGKDGHDGVDGTDGVGIESTTTDENGNTVVTYTDGTVQVIEHRWDYVSTLRAATPWVAGADLYGCGDCGITKVVYEKYEDSHYTKGLKYKLNEDGESYTVIGPGSSNGMDVVVPETYNGKPVTKILFIEVPYEMREAGHHWVKSIMIPKTVNDIFVDPLNTENIYVSEENENYKSIDGVLYSKDGKTLIRYPMGRRDPYFTVPEHVTTIGKWAFYNAYYLISITIGENITEIDRYSFCSCINLIEVYNLTHIENLEIKAYWVGHEIKCTHTSPEEESCLKITEDGFVFYENEGVNKLKGYTGENIEKIVLPESYEGGEYVIDQYTFHEYTQLKTVVIPDNVTEILDCAFYSCANLKNVILGKGIRNINRTLSINHEEKNIYYSGTEEEKNANIITDAAFSSKECIWYYYSEQEPVEEGNYWRYVDGEAVKW